MTTPDPDFDDVFNDQKEYNRTHKYCNICGYETKQDEDGCVYHQQVKTDSEGVRYLKYDEFDQDGNAY